MAAARYPEAGTVLLGKYVVESLIGVGGMAAVVKARHLDLDEPVAIKCLLPEMHERADIVQRFLREAKSAVKLKGEHVARVFDVGRLDDGTPYIVMEFLDGPDLGVFLKRHGTLSTGLAVDLILQACEAIAEAHSIGVVHRDIKAANFVVVGVDETPRLKVLDFGIATAPEGTTELTTTESVFGTPAYMAPEQMRSSRTADERSDIWSLGIVLYELVEGTRPFRAEIFSALCLAVGMDPPAAMTRAPAPLRPVVLRCLEKLPAKRYQSVTELARALAPFATDLTKAIETAEECARLLRRSAPKRRSRDSIVPASDAPTVKEPTSVTASSGEASRVTSVRPRRRGLGVALALAGVALAAIVVVVIAPWETADAVVMLPPPPVPKPDPEPLAKARYLAGQHKFETGDFRGAIVEWRAAHALLPRQEFLFNIAQAYRNLADRDGAIRTLGELRAAETNALAIHTIDEMLDELRAPPPAPPSPKPAKAKPRTVAKAAEKSPEAEPPPVTRTEIAEKLRVVKLGYDAYKAKNGARLEREWTDLQMFIQFQLRDDNLVDADNRIEAFRLRLREAIVLPQ